MIQDPLTTWDGPFPYDELAAAGITPASTHKQVVDDAPFALMVSGGLTSRAQRALDELRDPERRLVADFLLYDVDLAGEIDGARESLGPADGEPEVVTEVLSTTPGWLAILATQIAQAARQVTGSADPAVPDRPEPGALPVLPLIDALIEFDR
jgi:hypothetical protein